MLTPNRLALLAAVALAAGALTGCEAGTVEKDSGRFVTAETAGQRTQAKPAVDKRDRDDRAADRSEADRDDATDDRSEVDRDDATDDRSEADRDGANEVGEATSAVAAYAQAELDARGQTEPIPDIYEHAGASREFPELPPDLVLPESVAAAEAAAAAASDPDPDHAPSIDAVSPSNAPASGGSELQIHGKNLHAYRVAVGFAPARILAVQEAGGTVTLTVAAPPRTGPATVAVVVTNRDGSVAVASQPFQYFN